MKRQISTKILVFIFALSCFLVLLNSGLATQAKNVSMQEPPYPPPEIITPVVSPEPTSQPPLLEETEEPSPAALSALVHLAQKEDIPEASLVVVTDHSTQYPNLARKFQVVTLLDTRPDGKFYKFLVDLDSGEIIDDIEAMLVEEDHTRFEKTGKLQPNLYERLQTMQDDENVMVTIWVISGPGKSQGEREQAALATLTAKYPEAQAAVELASGLFWWGWMA